MGFDGLIGRMMISRLRPADFARDDRKRPVFDMTSKGLSMRCLVSLLSFLPGGASGETGD